VSVTKSGIGLHRQAVDANDCLIGCLNLKRQASRFIVERRNYLITTFIHLSIKLFVAVYAVTIH